MHYRVIRVTGSIRVTGQLVPGRVGSRVSTADPVPSLGCGFHTNIANRNINCKLHTTHTTQ